MKLKRNNRIRLFKINDNQFEVRSREDDVLIDSDSDYFIYLQNVNFINGNIIEGRYLGELSDSSSLIDDRCANVDLLDDKFYSNGKQVRTAKMVAVNNKTKIIIIISNER